MDPQQQWSVHAEFTISHPKPGETEIVPKVEQADNGVRMTYTWTTPSTNQNVPSTRSTPPPSSRAYNFQRGNLTFTSTPPRSLGPKELSPIRRLIQDSGYGSDLMSPNSSSNCVQPKSRCPTPFNRKCRSTCNIVLSTSIQEESREDDDGDAHTMCGRTQSLRCQTPTLRCDRRDNFYGCGDPWCHHLHYDEFSNVSGRFSPVPEAGEDLSDHTTSAKTPSTVRCCERASLGREPETRRDASVQTYEMIDKCTSPFAPFLDDTKLRKYSRKYSSKNRRRTEPIFQRSHSPSTITPDSLENSQVIRTARSRLNKVGPAKTLSKERETSVTSGSGQDPLKKPRTVHIDVYCTGTEMESDSSDSSWESSRKESTPQTVFESNKVRITHERAKADQLPLNVQKSSSGSYLPKSTSGGSLLQGGQKLQKQRPVDSDNEDDMSSSAYPSKLSSYSTIRDFSSSMSSVPPSWATYSMSSFAGRDDDSTINTSWKDTFSDIDSLLHSRSSIAQTDSLDFVPRRFNEKNASIDETPEIEQQPNKNLLMAPSQDSIQPSDSFEYANSEDRFRIKRMEELWKNKTPNFKFWKSPGLERKHLLQQNKIKEYLEKRLSEGKTVPTMKLKESDSEGSDESEKGWTFVKETPKQQLTGADYQQSKIETSKSPTALALAERLKQDAGLRAPFTITPGIYTGQRAIAKKFGDIIPVSIVK